AGPLAPEMPRHERRRLHVVEVEEVGAIAARDLERVAEALGRDQARLHALALGERVDHECRAVRKEGDLRERYPALAQHVDHTLLEVRRCRVRLRRDDLLDPRVRIGREVDEGGEGAAALGRRADRLRAPALAHVEALSARLRCFASIAKRAARSSSHATNASLSLITFCFSRSSSGWISRRKSSSNERAISRSTASTILKGP